MLLTGADNMAQFLTVLVIFAGVLAITLWTTKWIAKYQKVQCANRNIEVMETCRLATNKYVQILRMGEKYVAVAVCKDTVTLLGEIPKEQIEFPQETGKTAIHFKELFEKAKIRNTEKADGSKEEKNWRE